MKRFLTTLVTVLVLTAALAVTASASTYDAAAEDLSKIGMFRGTEQGFELDRAPTRSEAAIMLVRLYGAEEKAAEDYAAGTISHPFTDVSDSVAPYVAWLYTNGITKGTTETTFTSRASCGAQQYVVFLLRALGYQDGKDFEYADALNFAMTKGLFETSMLGGTFLRDDLAAVTYQALGTDLKDGSTYLLDSLVDSGAVDAQAAKPITEKIETYRALMKASSATMSGNVDADFDMTMKLNMAMDATESGTTSSDSMQMDLTGKGQIQMILSGEQPQLALSMEMSTMGETMVMKEWLKDGWIYMESDGSSYKYKLDGMDEFLASYQQLLDMSTQMSGAMLPMVDTITAKTSGSNTVYTLTMNDAMAGMVNDLLGTLTNVLPEEQMAGLDLALNLKDCSYVYTVTNGQLKDCKASMDMDMTMNIDAGEGTSASLKMNCTADVALTINATGDSVKITYPDFSKFEEIDTTLTPEVQTVYITKTGSHYHYDPNCNGGTYYESTLEEATNLGLTPCAKCVLN